MSAPTANSTLPDDTVQYLIFPLKETTPRDELLNLREDILAFSSQYVMPYIWNCDRFNLKVSRDQTHLVGQVTFGQNVEDEWFVVGILARISEHIKEVAIRVADNDGEILLIEAADVLPTWAQEPDEVENRVYLYQGHVHIIPLAKSPAQLSPIPAGIPSVRNAVSSVAKYSKVTMASDEVQKCIKNRIGKYPENWSQYEHYIHAHVPKQVAILLERYPHFISQAVHHVTNRDPLDNRVCQRMSSFPSGQDLVKIRVLLTKHLYAVLAAENLVPFKKSGWTLPPKESPEYKSRLSGFRITCGFEILFARINKLGGSERGAGDLNDKILQRLNGVGYFRNNLVGSKEYKELYEQARLYYGGLEEEEDGGGSNVAEYLSELSISKSLIDNDSLSSFTPGLPLQPESSDDWLNVDRDAFDEMLGRHFRVNSDSQVPKIFEKFFKSSSDMKGVEEETNEEDLAEELQNAENASMDFDVDQMKSAFEKLLRASENGLNEDIEFSDSSEDELENGDEVDKEGLDAYLKDMQGELEGSNVFEEDHKDLDIDVNLLKNLLSSYQSQIGDSGPTNTLIKSVIDKKAKN